MVIKDVERFKRNPATGTDAGNQAVTDSNIKALDRIAIPANETNTFNGGKAENGVVNLSRNSDGDLVFQSYADGKWTEYLAVLDGLKSVGGITLDGNEVTVVAPVKWRINSVNYQKLINTVITVNSATDGFKRIDYIYADTNNNILLIEGTEVADGNPYIPPILPANTVMVAPVYISGDTILQPLPDLSIYITKSQGDEWYIQASPLAPQDAFILLSGNITADNFYTTFGFSLGTNSGGITYYNTPQWHEFQINGVFNDGFRLRTEGLQRLSDSKYALFEGDALPISGGEVTGKITGSDLFIVTDPKDYTQAGYVDEENRKSILQNIKSYSILGGLDANKRNYGFVLTADSNGEGYVSTGVGENNWFTILTRNIQSIQGGKSGIGFSDFNDPSRYGITISSGVSILPYGPVKQGLFMNAGSSITFSAAADFVEVWYWNDTVAGSLEFRRNGVLYRTVSAAGAHNEAVSSFDETPTPDGSMATYEIKAVDSSVFVTTLFKDIKYAEGNDTYYFLRHAVAGKSFDDFDLPQLLAVNSLSTEVPRAIYLCALGTNSIYSPDKAQTSTAYATSLRSYIQTLKVNDNRFVYLMPPKGLETTYPPILEPYLNYYNIAKQVCLEEHVMFIDANELDFDNNPSYYGSDGLHYSDAGNIALGNFVTNQLAKADLRSFDYLTPADVATGKEIGANTTGSAQYWNSQVYDGSVNNVGLGLLMGYNTIANKWTYYSLGVLSLESITDIGNSTNNAIQVTGQDNVDITKDSLILFRDPATSQGGIINAESSSQGSQILFNRNSTDGLRLTGTDVSFGLTLKNTTANTDLLGIFDGRIQVQNGTASSDAVNKGQLDGAVSGAIGVTVNSTNASLALTGRGYYNYIGNVNATWTLPTVSGNAGLFYRIYNKASGGTATLTLDASGSETFFRGGVQTITIDLAYGENLTIQCDGGEWNCYN